MLTQLWKRTLLTVVLGGAAGIAGCQPALSGGAEPSATATTSAGSREHVMFGGTPDRNMINLLEKNVPEDWDVKTKKNIKWSAKLGSRSYGGPIISGGKVFVGTNNNAPRNPARDSRKRSDGKVEAIDKSVLMCFDEPTGKFLWQHVNEKLPSGQVHDWPEEGICSTPIVEGNRLYYVNNRCEVVCLDTNGFADGNQGVQDEQFKEPTDADVIWRLNMMKDLNVFPHNLAACSPLIVGDLIYVVTANGVDENHENIPSPDAPSFLAIEKTTGKPKWKSNAPGLNIMHGQWSNPAYAVVKGVPQVIFPGGDGWMRGFDPKTGKVLWEFDANPKTSVYKLGARGSKSDFIATPVIVEDKMYIGIGQDPEHVNGVGHLWCVDITKSGDISPELIAQDDPDPSKRKTKPNPNSGVVWHYGGYEKNPDEAGRDFVFSRTMSTCAVHDGLCYVADLPGYFYCLDAKTGKLLWSEDMKSETWGSPYWVDGKVYIGTADNEIWIFPHGRTKPEAKRVEMGRPVKSTPVVANGVLYVMTESQLYAIQGK